MKPFKHLVIIFLSLVLASCDPAYDIDYIIQNESEGDLQISGISGFADSLGTNIISDKTSLIIYEHSGLGISTKGYLKSLEEPYLFSLSVQNENEINYTNDILDITRWEIQNPSDGSSTGRVTLVVTKEDFE